MVKLFCAIVGVAGSAFSVRVDESDEPESVDDLKKEIKKEKPNDFKDVDADKLQLFLAKKHGAWLDGAGAAAVTLDEDGPLRGFGDQMDPTLWVKNAKYFGENFQPGEGQIHVLVVVPEQGTSAPLVSDGGVFDRCSDPFFSKFQTVYQVGDWLEFSSLLPLTRRQKLYIRSSYRVIADQALLNPDGNMVKYAVVTGTPGVGKSVFVYYVMWRLIKDRKRVLLFEGEGNFYFDGTTMFTCKALPDKSNLQFWSPDLWCLVDSLDPTSIPGLPYRRCSVLLASTPRRDCIGEFKKLAPTPDVFYMPLWTKEELATIAPMYPHAAAVWENRFECLGGVPRLVLQDI
ncbi:hypothetical protein Pcac1_g21821 [Phytophthora cactorum]|nr:hypothetical protein Pcac1_g21821 [Phytophthora cactorum]